MARTNIRQFQLGISRFVDQAKEARRDRVKAVTLRIFRGVVLATRVDTGRLRGNWQVGEGSPPNGTLEREDPSGRETLSEGNREILSASGDEILWLHNGLPYAVVWENEDKMVAGNVEAIKTWLRSG